MDILRHIDELEQETSDDEEIGEDEKDDDCHSPKGCTDDEADDQACEGYVVIDRVILMQSNSIMYISLVNEHQPPHLYAKFQLVTMIKECNSIARKL